MSLFWHPYQKLWNRSLVRRLRGRGMAGQAVITVLIWVDSLILLARAAARRVRSRGARDQVVYVDCGLHKHGEQLRWVRRWFGDDALLIGIEASPSHFADASANLSDLNATLIHAAVVGPQHTGDTVRLYRASDYGKDDSLFVQRGSEFEDVTARRLSSLLQEQGLADRSLIVRMNIEGAERFVVEDLLDARIPVRGWFGMWDDLGEIDAGADLEFRGLLRKHGISPFTFNDRDLPKDGGRLAGAFALRRLAIRIALDAAARR